MEYEAKKAFGLEDDERYYYSSSSTTIITSPPAGENNPSMAYPPEQQDSDDIKTARWQAVVSGAALGISCGVMGVLAAGTIVPGAVGGLVVGAAWTLGLHAYDYYHHYHSKKQSSSPSSSQQTAAPATITTTTSFVSFFLPFPQIRIVITLV